MLCSYTKGSSTQLASINDHMRSSDPMLQTHTATTTYIYMRHNVARKMKPAHRMVPSVRPVTQSGRGPTAEQTLGRVPCAGSLPRKNLRNLGLAVPCIACALHISLITHRPVHSTCPVIGTELRFREFWTRDRHKEVVLRFRSEPQFVRLATVASLSVNRTHITRRAVP